MENSPLLWALVVLVFILILLRIFGRNLPSKISTKDIPNKWIYLGGIILVMALIAIGFGLWLPDDKPKYEEPHKPWFSHYYNTFDNIGDSNHGKIKRIEQVVCTARDSLGEIVCDKIENAPYFDNELIKFDKIGRVIESDKISIPGDDNFFKTNNTYDEKSGELLEIIMIAKIAFEENSIIHQRTLFEYSKGNKTEALTYRNGVYYDSVTFNYNSDNLIKEIIHFEVDSSETNSLSSREVYLYYDDKKVKTKYNKAGQLTDQETFIYDNAGNCIKEVSERFQEPFKYHRLYTYDKLGRITVIEEYKNDTLVRKYKYSYEGPKLLQEEIWSFENEIVSYYRKNTVEYNQNGHVIFETDSSFNKDEFALSTTVRRELKYSPKDSDNWVEMTQYINGVPRYKVLRKIEYY